MDWHDQGHRLGCRFKSPSLSPKEMNCCKVLTSYMNKTIHVSRICGIPFQIKKLWKEKHMSNKCTWTMFILHVLVGHAFFFGGAPLPGCLQILKIEGGSQLLLTVAHI